MMKKGRMFLLTLCTVAALCTGCGQDKKIYEQAGKDLEQGSYSYALEGYEQCISEGIMTAQSYRGAGLCYLRLGEYDQAIAAFTEALSVEKSGKALKQDVLYYRAAANLKAGYYEAAMADCQTLTEDYGTTGETAFLTASAALELDSYEEARTQFDLAFQNDSSYDMAIRIYQNYVEKGMEADGTAYLEASLNTTPKDAQDYCDRGRIYYYMEDYQKAGEELQTAIDQGSVEALLLMGMTRMAQNDLTSARSMYLEYIAQADNGAKGYNGLALCDIAEGSYDSALSSISQGISSASTKEMQSLLFNEIVAYEKKLDFVTAQQKAEEFVAMFPEDEEAARELEFLKSRTGDTGA